MTLDEQIGARARAIRGPNTLAQVVERARERGEPLTVPVLSQLELGKRRWNTRYMQMVAEALGVPPQVFIGGHGQPQQVRNFLATVAKEARRLLVGSDDGPGPNAGAAAYLGGLALATG